ncbi:hypothetical protein FGO68_gene14704 [Halteria grandinella]|uniref:Uncharacterized protein n=1 Tax=Halteria grandinella TaxID=5974 RepID=A0A8J8T5I7_HALGN|nr:hypothetical protein FGO68_gene14704 [Halteria grandinella]
MNSWDSSTVMPSFTSQCIMISGFLKHLMMLRILCCRIGIFSISVIEGLIPGGFTSKQDISYFRDSSR